MTQPLFLDQLAMALAYRQYSYANYCLAHELDSEQAWVKDRWNECRLYSSFYHQLSDERIEALLDDTVL